MVTEFCAKAVPVEADTTELSVSRERYSPVRLVAPRVNFPLLLPVTVSRSDEAVLVPDKVTVPPVWKVCSALTVRVFPPSPVAVKFWKEFSPDKVMSSWKVAFVIIEPEISAVSEKVAVVIEASLTVAAAENVAVVMLVCPLPETVAACNPNPRRFAIVMLPAV